MSLTPALTGVTRTLGFLQVDTYRGAAQSFVHEPDQYADAPPQLLLGLHTSGRATLVRRGTAEACGPDDLFVCQGTESFALDEAEDFAVHLVRIPLHTLGLTGRQARALSARAPFADGPVVPLLLPLLRELAPRQATPDPSRRPARPLAAPADGPGTSSTRASGRHSESTHRTPLPDGRALPAGALADVSGRSSSAGLHIAGGVAELVALLAVEDGDTGPRDRGQEREAMVRRLRAYVDAHLWDRNLTPASVAAAQHISLRYLHRLFEGQDSTVGRWIQHRRLEEARRELARPGRGDITVAAVARRWGFASASHFSRSFRATYGMSPSDWRDGRIRPSGEPGHVSA
jgi:AraC-like DNA-binding protein